MVQPDDDDERSAEQAEIIRQILPFIPGPEDAARSCDAPQPVPMIGLFDANSPNVPVEASVPAQPVPPERMDAAANGRGNWRTAGRRGFAYGALAGAGAMALVGYFVHVQRAAEITSDLELRNRELGATVASVQARQAARTALGVGVLWRRLSGRRLQGVTPGWPGIGAGWATWDVRADGQMVMRWDNAATPCYGQVEGDYFVVLCAQDNQVAAGWIAPGPHGDVVIRGDKWMIEGTALRPVAAFAACPESPTWAKDCTTPMWIEFDELAARDIAQGICVGVDTDACRQVGSTSWTFPDKASSDSAFGSQKLSELRRKESTFNAGVVDAGSGGGCTSCSLGDKDCIDQQTSKSCGFNGTCNIWTATPCLQTPTRSYCRSGSGCVQCGTIMQDCCPSGTPCEGALKCQNGSCQQGPGGNAGTGTGDAGGSSCTDQCAPRNTWQCNTPTEEYDCVQSGGCNIKAGVAPCASGKVCVPGMGCRPCGFVNEPCCANRQCSNGGTCLGTDRCGPRP